MYSGIVNGEPTTFGTSGLLYRSNKVMYDRATRSLWNQFIGEPVIGPLADSGIRQPFFPSVVTTWEEWLAEHPDTTVLDRYTNVYPPDFYVPENDPRAIYYDYFTSDEVMFPVWNRDITFEPKAVVVGLSIGDSAKAYGVTDLQEVRLINDTVGGLNVVVVASPESRAGRIYERGETVFSLPEADDPNMAPTTLVDETGAPWQVTESGLVNSADPSAVFPRIPSLTSFWFGWFQYHPDTAVSSAPHWSLRRNLVTATGSLSAPGSPRRWLLAMTNWVHVRAAVL